jgi:uncharacterized protein (DUF1778 family)
MKTAEKARFDAKIPKEQKEFFEYAANLGGYRTLTEFVLFSVQERANKIVEEHNKIIASKRDQDIFFNEIIKPSGPNDTLKKTAIRYNELINS